MRTSQARRERDHRSGGTSTGGMRARGGAADHWRDVRMGLLRNLGKGLYTSGGYAGLINYYIEKDHAPAVWKAVMALAANMPSWPRPPRG